MVRWDELDLASYINERDWYSDAALNGDHHAETFLFEEFDALGSKLGGQQAVGGGWRATALDVSENGDAGFEIGEGFQLLGQAPGIASVAGAQFGQGSPCLLGFRCGFCLFLAVLSGGKALGDCCRNRAFRDSDNAEIGAMLAAPTNRIGDGFHLIGDFRNQNHVRSSSDA